MPLQAIEPLRLYEQVAQQIARSIGAGEYAAGDRLPPERDLAKRLGVSRPTVREAMIALEISGLVEIRTGAGTFVRAAEWQPKQPTSRTVDAGPSPFDLLRARHLIEGEIAAQAAERVTADDLTAIEQTISGMERAVTRGGSARDLDRQFHARIAAGTRNSVLITLVDGLWEGMFAPIFNTLTDRFETLDDRRRVAAEHRAIYDCLVQHDAAGARAAMRRHLANVEAVLAGADEAASGCSVIAESVTTNQEREGGSS